MWFSIACFGVDFGDVSPYVQIVLIWSKLLSGLPLGESCLLLTLCSLFIMSICNFSYFPFWFEGGIGVLIVSVPIYCLFVAFRNMKKYF